MGKSKEVTTEEQGLLLPRLSSEQLSLQRGGVALASLAQGLARRLPGAESLSLAPSAAQMGLAQRAARAGLEAQRLNLQESLRQAMGAAAERGAALGLPASSVTSTGMSLAQRRFLDLMASAGQQAQSQISSFAMELPFRTAEMRQRLALGQLAGIQGAEVPGMLQFLQGQRLAEAKRFGKTTKRIYDPWGAAGSILGSLPVPSIGIPLPTG